LTKQRVLPPGGSLLSVMVEVQTPTDQMCVQLLHNCSSATLLMYK